jgi:hypothetical protein
MQELAAGENSLLAHDQSFYLSACAGTEVLAYARAKTDNAIIERETDTCGFASESVGRDNALSRARKPPNIHGGARRIDDCLQSSSLPLSGFETGRGSSGRPPGPSAKLSHGTPSVKPALSFIQSQTPLGNTACSRAHCPSVKPTR